VRRCLNGSYATVKVKNEDRFLAQLLIPINVTKLRQGDELHIYDAYKADLQTQEEFTFEIKRWKARWELYTTKIQQVAVRGNYENPSNDAKGEDE
jgi:hypothetical protein